MIIYLVAKIIVLLKRRTMKWYKPRFLDETIIPEMHIHVSTATEPPDFEGL
jgi:hypothetical protein